MIQIQVDTTNPAVEQDIAEAIEHMLGLLPIQTIVATAPQPVKLVRVPCDDGAEYDLLFSIPGDMPDERAVEIVNDNVDDMYTKDPDDPVAGLNARLALHGILPVEVYETRNSY